MAELSAEKVNENPAGFVDRAKRSQRMKCSKCDKEITEDADPGRSWSGDIICEDCEELAIEYYGNHQYDGVDFDEG